MKTIITKTDKGAIIQRHIPEPFDSLIWYAEGSQSKDKKKIIGKLQKMNERLRKDGE